MGEDGNGNLGGWERTKEEGRGRRGRERDSEQDETRTLRREKRDFEKGETMTLRRGEIGNRESCDSIAVFS